VIIDQGWVNREIKSFGNINQDVSSLGGILKKKELKNTNRKIAALIMMSFKTILACLY
jgi:hypothetical protein